MILSPLCTDFYQLTMAQSYFKASFSEEEACFHISFRKHPFGGAFALAAGLESACEYLKNFRFSQTDLEYLKRLNFDAKFIKYLGGLKLNLIIDALPEGTPVFALEPMLRIRGPLLQCQILETPLLNIINFQSLIATKAARMALAAGSSKVIDFGLRRAQGFDGALSASRAAYIGGCAASSNVLAGKLFGIEMSGTMAHSFIMRFADEKQAFLSFAESMPEKAVFLVDTYNTFAGIENAIDVGHMLRSKGHDLLGIRLDSGDMEALSKHARKKLDSAGFTNTKIIASNELDEYKIEQLKVHNAPIDSFGVGTRLITAFDEPALGGVYKLAAIRAQHQPWQYRIKISDTEQKSTVPGILQIRRTEINNKFDHDIIYDESTGISTVSEGQDLLRPIINQQNILYNFPSLQQIQAYARNSLEKLPKEVVRLNNPQNFRVIFDPVLIKRKKQMLKSMR